MVPSQEGRFSSLFWVCWLLWSYVFKKITTTFLSKKYNNSPKLFPSSEGLGVGPTGLANSKKSTAPDHPPLWSPPKRGRSVSLFWVFWLLGSDVFKQVTSTFSSKKCYKSHKLFPSSEGLGVGSYRLANSMKSTAPVYPPLWSPP